MFTFCQGALPKKERNVYQRRLVVVDIENVIGTATFSASDVALARQLIEDLIGPIMNELVIVGSSHMGMFAIHRAWRSAKLMIQSGPDGADLRLLEELEHRDIAERFTDVVLVSGDGIFTETVAGLTACGLAVTVVAPIDGCARRLEVAATKTLKFDRAELTEGGAA